MSDPVIRAATADDVPAISALVQHTVRISNGRDYPPKAVEQIVANFAPARLCQRMAERDVFVCLKGGRIVRGQGSARVWWPIWKRTLAGSACAS